MHSAWRSIFCNANCNCGCLTWREAARSLCWGVHSFSIKAAFQASSPLCLRTSLIKAAASMHQSYLGNAGVPSKFLWRIEQLGGAYNWFNIFDCWSKVSQPPIPVTSHKEAGCLQEHKQLSDIFVCTKSSKSTTWSVGTGQTCIIHTLASMCTKASAWICSRAWIFWLMPLSSSGSAAAICNSIEPRCWGINTAAYSPG